MTLSVLTRPNNRLQGMRGIACFGAKEGLARRPRSLTLVSLGRWTRQPDVHAQGGHVVQPLDEPPEVADSVLRRVLEGVACSS